MHTTKHIHIDDNQLSPTKPQVVFKTMLLANVNSRSRSLCHRRSVCRL